MRVGTRFVKPQPRLARQDHPHACGDKSIVTPATFVVKGSSPCVWGQDSAKQQPPMVVWIIPMRVGTRRTVTLRIGWNEDHPHACGDKLVKKYLFHLFFGSSPCVWGQVFKKGKLNFGEGIIPMRVGTRAVRPDTAKGR